MNQGTQGYSLTKKTEGRKSRDTVSLKMRIRNATVHKGIQNEMTSDCLIRFDFTFTTLYRTTLIPAYSYTGTGTVNIRKAK
jgi:hypothetical protein